METRIESTKEKIVFEALQLFSLRGYDGVSMRDIASNVGIKAASLYNHFKSKEDLFQCIIDEMTKRYEHMMSHMQVPHGEMSAIVAKYSNVTEENLIAIASSVFLYFLQDDFASKFRRMLTMEQFKNEINANIFQKFFIEDAIAFQSKLFKEMMQVGVFIECDSNVMAYHFYSPIFLLLMKYGQKSDETRQDEALIMLRKHVVQFNLLYTKTRIEKGDKS